VVWYRKVGYVMGVGIGSACVCACMLYVIWNSVIYPWKEQSILFYLAQKIYA
jgi:hypothetical protein